MVLPYLIGSYFSICLYADDTKIWRTINSENDCTQLQKDINTLHNWSIKNKMRFNATKCKVPQIHNNEPLCTRELPLAKYFYNINNEIIDFTESEKDLGVWVNSKFKWDQHQQNNLNKAHQMLGITKRTCHFITDPNKRRSLYLSLVRSQFEHCSIIWRPVTETEISAFEKLQKKAIKWILNELYQHYDNETYLLRCSQIKIVPRLSFFDINDLVFFYKIVNNKIPFSLPDYIKPYSGKGRLRQSNLDSLCYISTFASDSTNLSSRSPFYKSFFHKVLHVWNSLPFSIRNMTESTSFKHKVINHYWSVVLYDNGIPT